ncbi:MAG: hypothetical protein JNL44_15575, partial [Gemmatimonadetes bacterium]|nr:hypothetical protein [Gemmatimonadota bacterium]
AHSDVGGTFPAFSVRVRSRDELPALLTAPTPRFVLFVAADTLSVAGPALVDWALEILNRGATYVCCWGPGCERLEACFDEASGVRENWVRTDRVIMTTAHASETMIEAVWFALHAAFPDDGWAEGTGAVILATVGNEQWAVDLQTYLSAGAPLPAAP